MTTSSSAAAAIRASARSGCSEARAAALRIARAEVQRRSVIGSWQALLDYCTIAAGYAAIEEFRLLFLDKKKARARARRRFDSPSIVASRGTQCCPDHACAMHTLVVTSREMGGSPPA
jgi:hypothetical protein